MSEEGYDPAGDRLRRRARWAGAVIALTVLLPYEVIDGHPQFVWQLFGELERAGTLAAIAPLLAGLAILLCSALTRRNTALAVGVLAAFAGAGLLIDIGADHARWQPLPLPESLSQRASFPLLALGFTAAGANLRFHETSRRLGAWMLCAGFALAALYYSWPGQGEAPIGTVLRALGGMDALPDWRFKLGLVVLAVLILWPGIMALVGLVHLRRLPVDAEPVIGIVSIYGLPLLLAMLTFRAVPGSAGGWNVFTGLGAVFSLGALLALLASGMEVAARDLGAGLGRRALLIATGLVALVGVTQWALARPPAKGVEWVLKASTVAGDDTFGPKLIGWNQARLRWDRQARGDSGAQALLSVKQAGNALVQSARDVDPGLAKAIESLVKAARSLDVAGRRWYRLIAAVNSASQAAGLPYYLDPTVIIMRGKTGIHRHFRMRSYTVSRVHRYRVEGRDYATLHVRRLDSDIGALPLLGFSRDLQPFAIVNLDEVESLQESLIDASTASPPRCGDYPKGLIAGLTSPVPMLMQRCGARLAEHLAKVEPEGLRDGLIGITDRHELQHQIDGPHLSMSSAVLKQLPAFGLRFQRRVNRELSAYVAEFTAPEASAFLGLVHLLRFAAQGRKGQDVWHVSVIALEAMGGRALVDDDLKLDGAALLEVFEALAALDERALRARAAKAWRLLYGGTLTPITRARASSKGGA